MLPTPAGYSTLDYRLGQPLKSGLGTCLQFSNAFFLQLNLFFFTFGIIWSSFVTRELFLIEAV